MIRMIEPDYIHYTRLETIYADEAKWLLAVFELRDKEFSDKDTYEAQFAEQLKLATRVLSNAFKKPLKPICDDPDAISFDDYGNINGYDFNLTRINFVSFCTWAHELKYNLPDTLAAFVKSSDCNKAPEEKNDRTAEAAPEPDETQKTDEAPGTEEAPSEKPSADDGDKENQGTSPANAAPEVNSKSNKGGKPKGYLSEAVEHVYNKILQQEKPGLLKPSKIREFIICMKEMATKSSRHADEYVMARIKSISAPEEGACTIITEDNVKLSGQNETIVRGKPYTNNDVAKILTKLRKK